MTSSSHHNANVWRGSRRPRRLASVVLGLLGLGAVLAARAADANEVFFAHAAACTALHKTEVETLRKAWVPGKKELREEILRHTVSGFSFVATTYKQGLRNPQADELLKAAEEEQKALTPAERLSKLNACATEGATLLRDMTSVERWFIQNRSNARVERLLAPKD